MVVLEGLDGRLSVQHEGRIIAAQEAPPNAESLRKGRGPSPSVTPLSHVPGDLGEPQATAPETLNTMIGDAKDYDPVGDEEDMVAMTVSTSPRKPTFLQRERWKAVQQAKRKGLSIRGMARELGIHRDTVRRYIDAESPPTRRTPETPPVSTSDTIAD